jgi:ABC-type multidrug transport system fused ATPase/permease subunit
MALIAICIMPLMVVGSMISASGKLGFTNQNEAKAESDLLAADAISNAKTVASFGCDDQIVKKYKKLTDIPYNAEITRLNRHAIGQGISQFSQQVVIGAMYYATGRLVYHHP